VFGVVPGEVTGGMVADAHCRDRRAGAPAPRAVMNSGRLERLRRARDRLPVTGYDTEQTRLTCYSGARFDSELVDRAAGDPLIQLVGLAELYG